MSQEQTTELERHPDRIAKAALQSFFELTKKWGLSATQERTLLGLPPESTFHKWQKEQTAQRLDNDTLERVSNLLGIHHALCVLTPNEQAANDWLQKPNHAPLLNGQSALSRMLAGNVTDFYAIRKYLDGQTQL